MRIRKLLEYCNLPYIQKNPVAKPLYILKNFWSPNTDELL